MATAPERYGRLCGIWISLVPAFVLFDPTDVQRVLSSARHSRKMFAYRFLRSFLGAGLLTINGEKWRQHHRLIAPALRQRKLVEFVAVFARASARMVDRLEAVIDSDVNVTVEANEYVVQVLHGELVYMVYL